MTINKKYMYALLAFIFVIIGAFMIKAALPSSALTQAEIDSLRLDYPIYSGAPELISMVNPSIEEIVHMADAFVIAEVIEEIPEYSIDLITDKNTPEAQIHEKGQGLGSAGSASFIQYRIKILDNIFEKGLTNNQADLDNIITIVINSQFRGFVPELEPKMKIVIPVKAGSKQHQGKYFFSKQGFYYVTEQDFVLSAFVEQKGSELTGKTLDYLIRKIREMTR